jgi:hypothetical protein
MRRSHSASVMLSLLYPVMRSNTARTRLTAFEWQREAGRCTGSVVRRGPSGRSRDVAAGSAA